MILSFLQHLFALGQVESTIWGYLAAVSVVHEKCDGASPGAHPLVTQFLRGVRRSYPMWKCLLLSRDLQVVLGALCLTPFEPMPSLNLQLLCLKTALSMAIVSAKQVSDLSALSVDPACLRFGDRDRVVCLLPDPAFQPVPCEGPQDLCWLH